MPPTFYLLCCKYQLTQYESDKSEYERLQSATKKLIKQSKKNLEVHIGREVKLNPKEFYSYVRQKKCHDQ